MKFAFVLTFHKDIEICQNRIRMLRKYNPDLPIHGVYGGEADQKEIFQKALGGLDSFYHFDEGKNAMWKWFNFDLLVAKWYELQGHKYDFDSIVWVHWDQLVLGPITEQFKHLKKGEMFINGLRPAHEVEDWWCWVSKDKDKAPPGHGYETYMEFLNHLKAEYNYSAEPMFSQPFITICPREFLDPYSKLEWPVRGYGEYRMPMYAQVFDVPLCTSHKFGVWWPDDPQMRYPSDEQRVLTPMQDPLPLKKILKYAADANAPKLIHPYYRIYPITVGDWLRLFRDKLLNRRYKQENSGEADRQQQSDA